MGFKSPTAQGFRTPEVFGLAQLQGAPPREARYIVGLREHTKG